MPGKADAKMTPVSSRRLSGSIQRSGRNLPVVVLRHVCTSGIPASRNASSPAAIASCVVVVERLDQLLGDAVLGREVEGPRAPGQLDHVGGVVDGLEAAAAVLGLHDARDVLVRHLHAEAFGQEVDELLAAEDPLGVGGSMTDFSAPGRPEARAGDHDRPGGRVVAVVGARCAGCPSDCIIDANICVTVSTDGDGAGRHWTGHGRSSGSGCGEDGASG